MSTTIDMKWNGNEVKIRGRRVVDKTAYETGLIVEGHAKAFAAVDTGRLRGSITVQAADGQGTQTEAPATARDQIGKPNAEGEVYVGTAVDYAPYVEYGTMRSSAQPFLRPALDLARGQVLTLVVKNGRNEFKEYLQ